jgi:hypothetical protein
LFKEHPALKAAELDALRKECALKILVSIPDKVRTVFNHLAIVDVLTDLKVI